MFTITYTIKCTPVKLDGTVALPLQNIRIKMVEAHRANIMDKFEVRTMADLMRRFLGSSPD